ncbi:MAG TPA: VOC family protein [Candidatus Acidoferrales bacterium]|nr:VOC family protein [Candidatus Acidoferrales bacterium]
MPPALRYVIEFVADMERAVRFYRDTLGLPLRFESPEWSEFSTGEVALALHPASKENPAGSIQLAYTAADLSRTYEELVGRGVRFAKPPTRAEFGGLLAEFLDSEDSRCSLGEAQA